MHGGGLLATRYNHSLQSLLSEVYPNFDWFAWEFEKLPTKFFDDPKNQRKFVDWAGKQLNVNEYSDWYNVKTTVRNCFL